MPVIRTHGVLLHLCDIWAWPSFWPCLNWLLSTCSALVGAGLPANRGQWLRCTAWLSGLWTLLRGWCYAVIH